MKKVLILAQYFPPAGGVGTFRVTKFVKFLNEYNWKPIVVTADVKSYKWIDKTLEKDIPKDTTIYRLPVYEIGIINNEGIRWLFSLIRKIGFIIRKEAPDIIYITGGPFFPLVMGPLIKMFFHVPYLVDLRDPWRLEKRLPPKNLKAWFGKVLTDLLEPIVIKNASKIVCATEPMRQEYVNFYKDEVLSSKLVTITNGYDEDDFKYIKEVKFNKFTILYTGKFNASSFRDPTYFFKALRILRGKKIDICFIHVGEPEREVIKLVQSIGIEDTVRFWGKKDYVETLAYSKGADILLIIGGGQKNEQTGKIFDYLGCKRPILALACSDGAIAEVVSKIPFAKLIDNRNPEEIANCIMEIYYRKMDLNSIDSFGQYSRRYLTGQLSKLLDEIIL